MHNKKIGVALLNPKLPYPTLRSGGVTFYSRIWPPIDLLNAASLLSENGISNIVIDAHAKRMDEQTTATACKKAKKVVISTSTLDRWQCPYPTIPGLKKLIEKIKEKNPSAEIILFGVHGTLDPKGMLQRYDADKVVVGDEGGILKAVKEDEKIITCNNTDINVLSPTYHCTEPRDYVYEIFGHNFCLLETSRGCEHGCSFCFKKMHGRYREKKLGRVISELKAVAAKGYSRVYFIDLNFCGNKKKVMELCGLIKKEKIRLAWACQTRSDTIDEELLRRMYSAGCRLIHLGIETHSSTLLNAWRKGITPSQSIEAAKLCKRTRIETVGFFMLGFPDQSVKEWKKTIGFAEKLGLDYTSFRPVTPYTKWRREPYQAACVADNRLRLLEKVISKAYFRTYFKPSKIARAITRANRGYLKILKEATAENF